jgi:MarR family transcriptional regulator for hemolysin
MTSSPQDLPPEYFFYLQYHLVKQREVELGKMLHAMNLTIPKWRILSTLNRLGRVSMGVVADFCAIDRTTLTRIMDQLVEVDYVARLADPRDRRQTNVDLTATGQHVYEVAKDAVIGFNEKALRGVNEEELRTLDSMLRKVIHNVIDDQEWAASILRFEAADV